MAEAAAPDHEERRQWRAERHEMRAKLRQLADMCQREVTRREADVEQLEVRLAAATAENAQLKRALERSRSTEDTAVRAAEKDRAAKHESMRAVWEESEREWHERWAAEAEARQEADARADLALRRQLELDGLLADQAEEAALILAKLQSYREQAEAERRLREAQDGKHTRELTELAARWERRFAIERGALERERLRITAERHRVSADDQSRTDAQAKSREAAAGPRLDSAVVSGKAYADSILRRVERQVEERHAAERAAAASPPLIDGRR